MYRVISPELARRAIIATSLGLSLSTAAFAAERQASSMAGAMAGSSAEMGAVTSAGGESGSQSSTSNTASSGSERSTASAVETNIQSAIPSTSSSTETNLAVRGNTGSPNPTQGSGGSAPRLPFSQSNGLIQSSVKPLADDKTTLTQPRSTANSSVNLNANVPDDRPTVGDPNGTHTGGTKVAPAKTPHAKVQYWNQHRR